MFVATIGTVSNSARSCGVVGSFKSALGSVSCSWCWCSVIFSPCLRMLPQHCMAILFMSLNMGSASKRCGIFRGRMSGCLNQLYTLCCFVNGGYGDEFHSGFGMDNTSFSERLSASATMSDSS